MNNKILQRPKIILNSFRAYCKQCDKTTFHCRLSNGQARCKKCSSISNPSLIIIDEELDEAIPEQVRQFLTQAVAVESSGPVGAVLLAASAIDAMLKAKGYKKNSLQKRIDQAASDGIITTDMTDWAHLIRSEGNQHRHADEALIFITEAEIRPLIDFTRDLAYFLFVSPCD